MTRAGPWTVVVHGADGTPPAVAASHLVRWMADETDIELHTVVWTAGAQRLKDFDHGHLINVGSVRRRLLPLRLQRLGFQRLGGGLQGRAVRARLRKGPHEGVVYLSSSFAGAALRYLPPGHRVVVTHLHAFDRLADPPLDPADVDRLRDATDVWVATDQDIASWAEETWHLGPGTIELVPGAVEPVPVNPVASARDRRRSEAIEIRLGLCSGTAFRSDHAPRVVQALHRLEPARKVVLFWPQPVSGKELEPMLHDFEALGQPPPLLTNGRGQDTLTMLDEVDLLAFTGPDDGSAWLAWEAGARSIPMVCFETHRAADAVAKFGGLVVPYPEVSTMAASLLTLLQSGDTGSDERAATLRARAPAAVGRRLLDLVEAVR